ncbi:MAG: AAA family ATPase [Prevotella sp.]|nr:AAA family ATPase [Prevotella sp.]MBQ3699999.1 AAA family ATPase [Prevotella sp.]
MNQDNFKLLGQAVKQAAMTPQELLRAAETEMMLRRLEDRRITPDKELPRMDFLFRLFHKPCFPRGELVALTGKAKSGKTFVSSILMALSFHSPVLSVERIEPKRLHVLWYDTEQSEESTQDILKSRVIPMTGIPESQFPMGLFDIFNVRQDGYDQRLSMLEAAVRRYHPDLVVLDGIRDLVADINDGVVAQDCIERLMRLASEVRCCMVCILHQNKSAEDRNLRGWIGTELKNKAFEVYQCEKSSERIFTWGQTDTRKYDILDTLKFAVGDEGIPYRCTEEQLKEAMFQAQKKLSDQRQREGSGKTLPPFNPKYVLGKENRRTIFDLPALFKACMEPGREYEEEALRTKIGMEANITTDRIANEQLSKAVSEGVVMQSVSALNGRKIYLLRTRHPVSPEQQELPFDNNDAAPF